MIRWIESLTNLAYEVFGIILPGLLACLTWIILWLITPPSVCEWAANTSVPTISTTLGCIEKQSDATRLLLAISSVLPSLYVLGHLLKWFSKELAKEGTRARWFQFWRWGRQILKPPTGNYDKRLKSIYEKAREQLEAKDWQAFYPIARGYISQQTDYSLARSFQNKYTLHRSIAALAFINLAMAIILLLGAWFTGPAPILNMVLVLVFATISWLVAMAFRKSYRDYWRLFGDTIIAETHALMVHRQEGKADAGGKQ